MSEVLSTKDGYPSAGLTCQKVSESVGDRIGHVRYGGEESVARSLASHGAHNGVPGQTQPIKKKKKKKKTHTHTHARKNEKKTEKKVNVKNNNNEGQKSKVNRQKVDSEQSKYSQHSTKQT